MPKSHNHTRIATRIAPASTHGEPESAPRDVCWLDVSVHELDVRENDWMCGLMDAYMAAWNDERENN